MPRREVPVSRETQPDAIYNSKLVSEFINVMMREGKKSLAESILSKAMKIIEEKTGSEGLKTFKQAIENVKPVLEVKSRRVGGATYQVLSLIHI